MKRDIKDSARNDAETIALQALTFILSEPRQLELFLGETGFTPAEVAANAEARHVLEAALAHLMANEALLLAFTANAGLSPEQVARAHDHLATDGGERRPLTSM